MNTATPRPSSRPARTVAAGVTVAQSLALLVLSGFYVVETVRGEAGDQVRSLMSVVLMLLFAGALAFLARALWRRPEAARTPAIVWNALLVPVAWGLFQSGQDVIGAVLLVTSLAAIVAAALAGRGDRGRS
ncbi:hypothetical protein [Segeticoccus rhizosphaerae]|uniref:hypothetical protein n=1 Tax=Segeticoccus rhizosphaerae TaxID=1104777 RepID=UPI0010BF82C0|nr:MULTISPECIES: hypothetical protein [Intrasporangiaceae]